jgi:transposase
MTIRAFKTGVSRDQGLLLPARIEDYVGSDNLVRLIAAYVGTLDLVVLGFRHAAREIGAGQPPYDPADLLGLYLYGYLNQVRSSRRLEREARRNVEVMWLLRGLVPGYRTIGEFRKDNAVALRAANRGFVRTLHELDLLGGDLVGIDGAFFHGNASKASMVTGKRLAERFAALEGDIEAYGAALETNDAAEANDVAPGGEDLGQKLAALLAKRERVQADLAQLAQSGETQLSHTDPDARRLSKHGQVVAGYNVQVAIDGKHSLIVASEVVNDGNDTGQLHALAGAAKAALEVATLTAVADSGYYNGETLRACEAAAIIAYVPPPDRRRRLAAQGRLVREDFRYDAEADVYRCPGEVLLRPMNGRKEDASGKRHILYVSLASDCAGCPLRGRCLPAKADRRTIQRWEHEAVIERHRARMAQPEAAGMMRRRAELAEHPFGTLKCRAGYRHFLLRGFAKVRGEWSLMALCYNLGRVASILGIDRFIAWLAARVAYLAFCLLDRLVIAAGGFICQRAGQHAIHRPAAAASRPQLSFAA